MPLGRKAEIRIARMSIEDGMKERYPRASNSTVRNAARELVSAKRRLDEGKMALDEFESVHEGIMRRVSQDHLLR